MNIVLVLIVFVQSILFKFFHLNIRKLQEKGLSPHSVAGLQRLAIVPAIFLFSITFKKEYLSFIISNPKMILCILGIMLFWVIGQYLGYFSINSTSSLSSLFALGSVINIPIYVLAGFFINHDTPNIFAVIALIILTIALIIKPVQHKDNKRQFLKYSIWVVILLIFTTNIAHSIDGALYKNVLNVVPVTLFGISIYILITAIMLNIVYIFKKNSNEEKSLIKENKLLAYSIPAFWFIASLPEGYSFANIPLFTIISISSVSFIIDILSDLKNKRIILNKHTISFIALIFMSIIFSACSLW